MYRHHAVENVYVDLQDRQAYLKDEDFGTLDPITKSKFMELVGQFKAIMTMPDLKDENEEEGGEEEEGEAVGSEEPMILKSRKQEQEELKRLHQDIEVDHNKWIDMQNGCHRYWDPDLSYFQKI